MKISMYMLEHALGSQISSCIIQSGQRNIRTARLFTDDCQIEDDCLYVGRTVDFFPSASSQEVMMVNRNDIISVISTDIRSTFNQVLSAFDRYNDIEQEMFAGIFKPNPEQCVLSACEHLIGPSFLLTTDYRTLACSQNYGDRFVNDFWDTIVHSGDLPLEQIMQMRDSVSHTLALGSPNFIRFVEPHAAPYCYGLISTYFGSERQILGHLFLSNTRPITNFEEDIAQIIMTHLNLIQASSLRPPQIVRYQNTDDVLLSNLLARKEPHQAQSHLNLNHAITDEHRFLIAVCKNKEIQIRDYIRKYLPDRIPCSICITQDDTVIVLYWYTEKNGFFQTALKDIADQTETQWGISNPFSDLYCTAWYYEQARFAQMRCRDRICEFRQIAADYLLTQKPGECRYYARHPLVLHLEQSNLESKSELLDTLREYLLCERSIKRAAEKLFVHRNTVTYRIDQLRQLQMMDFQDEYERQYALISLMLPL